MESTQYPFFWVLLAFPNVPSYSNLIVTSGVERKVATIMHSKLVYQYKTGNW